jgi:hypothetical protein
MRFADAIQMVSFRAMGCHRKPRISRKLISGALATIGTYSAVDDCLWDLAPPENRNLTKTWLRFVVSQVPKSEAPGHPVLVDVLTPGPGPPARV